MTHNSTDEPFVLAVETVDIGWSFHDNPDVTIKYRPRQYDCKVEKGSLTEIATLITVKSASGTTFKITRKQGGKYEAVSWFTWVRKRNQNQAWRKIFPGKLRKKRKKFLETVQSLYHCEIPSWYYLRLIKRFTTCVYLFRFIDLSSSTAIRRTYMASITDADKNSTGIVDFLIHGISIFSRQRQGAQIEICANASEPHIWPKFHFS